MVSEVLKKYLKLTGVPVLFASLCCLSPLILVIFGLASVSFAASLADVFYGTYKWVFRGVGLFLLVLSIGIYFWRRGVCTLDAVVRERNKILNVVLISLIVGVLLYVFFLYVVVHYLGVWFGIWV